MRTSILLLAHPRNSIAWKGVENNRDIGASSLSQYASISIGKKHQPALRCAALRCSSSSNPPAHARYASTIRKESPFMYEWPAQPTPCWERNCCRLAS